MKPSSRPRRKPAALLGAVALATGVWLASPLSESRAGEVYFGGFPNLRIQTDVESVRERRFSTVYRQRYDVSCGSAAIASLLTFHYDRPTSEEEVFRTMYDLADKEQVQRVGFSLLDMKQYLETVGYRSDGFRLTLADLERVGVPAITLLNTNGYRHFVLIKGVSDGRVMVGDPALGMEIVEAEEFESQWTGIIFLIRNKVDVGRASFNLVSDWQTPPEAPIGGSRQQRPIGTFLLNIRPTLNSAF